MGNTATDEVGNPVILDPATYYGNGETDIAITELFGGFINNFHMAYCKEYPLDLNHKVRKNIYNLYHILNHLNLFGARYLKKSESTIERLLAEIF